MANSDGNENLRMNLNQKKLATPEMFTFTAQEIYMTISTPRMTKKSMTHSSMMVIHPMRPGLP